MNMHSRRLCGLILLLPVAANASTFEDGVRLKNAQQLVASEAAFQTVLANDPSNIKALEQLAIVQSWQNKFDAAIATYRQLLAMDAHHNEGRVGLARVLYWNSERKQALMELEIALTAQPSEKDSWVLKGDVLMADHQPNAAREAYLKAKSLQGNRMDPALETKIAAAKPPKAWRLDVGYVADDFSQVRDDEHSAYIQLGYTTTSKTSIYAKWEEYVNFGETDRGVGLGVYWLLADYLLINAEWSTTTDTADFRPDDLVVLNAEFLFNTQWQPLLGYRHSEYKSAFNAGEVTTITPGLRWNRDRSSIELRHSRTNNLDDTTTSVNTGKYTFNGEHYSPYIAYTAGKEATPPLAVAEIKVISAGLVMRLNDAWSARVDYAREDRKDTYIHTSIGLGISAFF